MTNKQHLITIIKLITKIDIKTIESIFEIINKYDWAVFCSYMGEYDHPEERYEAKKTLHESLKCYGANASTIFELLHGDSYTSKFYEDRFHYMDDDMED